MIENRAEREKLFKFVKEFARKSTLTIEEDLGNGYVRLRVTEAEKRQALQDIRCVEDVVRELVRNSRDANSRRIYVASQKEKNRWRYITVIDDGKGIPESVQKRIFDSRVTSKAEEVVEDLFGIHGRGMALFSIKNTVDSIHLVRSEEGRGAIFKVVIDTHKLNEKGDQSTFPRLNMEEGRIIPQGTRNILHTLVEFVFEENPPEIFYGSNSETLSLLYAHSNEILRIQPHSSSEDKSILPMWHDISLIKEGKRLQEYAEGLGLEVSQRNAFRILDGEINPPPSINQRAECVLPTHKEIMDRPKPESKERFLPGNLSKRFSEDDLDIIKCKLTEACNLIGKKYFLKVVECKAKKARDKINFTIVVEDE